MLKVLEKLGILQLMPHQTTARLESGELQQTAGAAQELSAKLKEKELELTTQLDRNAQLEHSLWSVEYRMQWTEAPSMAEILLSGAPSSAPYRRSVL